MTKPDQWKPTQEQASHIENLIVRLELPTPGRAFVRQAILDSPCRPVSNDRGNVMFKYMSKKNNRVLELESRSGEYPQAVLLESDPAVVMWLCQAPRETLQLRNSEGQRTGTVGYTLDFLVFRTDKIVAIECRDEGELAKRMGKQSDQFTFDPKADQWRYRAAEEHFAAMGIEFQLIANRQIDSVYVNNLKYLEDFLAGKAEPIDPHVLKRLQDRVGEAKRMSFLDAIRDGFVADDLLYAIAHGGVYVDLHSDQLSEVNTAHLYASKEIRDVYRAVEAQELAPIQPIPGTMFLRAGAQFELGGVSYRIHYCGERDIVAQGQSGKLQTFQVNVLQELHEKKLLQVDGLLEDNGVRQLANCSERELEDAQRRLDALRHNDTSFYSHRSLSRFSSLIGAETNPLRQLLALVDHSAERGNRQPRYKERDEEVIKKAVEQKYNMPEAVTKKTAFKYYNELCDAIEKDNPDQPALGRVSFTTFCRRVESFKCDRARKGKRAAYQTAPIVSTARDPYPVHGVMAHEICYIDHTVLNLATVSSDEAAVPLQKANISVGLDGCTSQSRALIMSYDPPSTTTVLMVLRDYVRRNKRLPKILSLDNGKEFRGHGLQQFCQYFGIDLRFRPPGQPRGGAPIESLLGAIEKEVISKMTGNTIQMKDPRLVTKSVNGFNHAEHTLTSAYRIIEAYLFVDRENRIHPTLGVSPAEFERQRNQVTGEREHNYISYDENLMLATSPFAKRPKHKVCPRRGVWVDNMWYRHSMLRGLGKHAVVRVRTEPFAARIVYVEVKGRWYAAVGHNSRDLDGRTTREMEILRRKQLRDAGVNATKARLTNGTDDGQPRSVRPEDFDAKLALQQKENKQLFSELGLLGVMQPESEQLEGELPFDIARAPASLLDRQYASPAQGMDQVLKVLSRERAVEATAARIIADVRTGAPSMELASELDTSGFN